MRIFSQQKNQKAVTRMISDLTFSKGLAVLRAVFRFDPDKETAGIWRLYFNELTDEEFMRGIYLMAHPRTGIKNIYPHTNIPACVYEYVDMAKQEELRSRSNRLENWQIERRRTIEEQHELSRREGLNRLLERRPDLEKYVKQITDSETGVRRINE